MLFLRFLLLTLLLLQTAAQTINPSTVYPDVPAPPISTKHQLKQELSSWQNIQIFNSLLTSNSFLIPPNDSLILAPTNAAFINLLRRLVPQMSNPLSTAASITNTLDNLINGGNLTRILAYHIIPRDILETDLKNEYFTVSGGLLSFDNFPNITDVDPITQPRRTYRQISAINGSLMFLSDVLLPLPLEQIISSPNNKNTPDEMPDVEMNDSPVSDDDLKGTFPPEEEQPDFFSTILEALSPAVLQDPFVSNRLLIASRTDAQIMNALLRVMPALEKAVISLPMHILVPTDTAFIKLFRALGKSLDVEELKLPDVSDPGFLSNFASILKMISAFERIWSSVAGLPGLEGILRYHIIATTADYESLTEQSQTAPVATALQNGSLIFRDDSISDADESRDDPMMIASFPTLTGYVTLIDGVLTPFDTSVAGAVVDGAMMSPTPSAKAVKEKEEENGAACFPADGMVYTKHGVRKIGQVMGGDEIVVDEGNRHSAVFMFTHKQDGGIYKFVKIYTAAGYNITLTSGHYVTTEGSITAAGNIRVGDKLRTIGGRSAVVKVEYVSRRGLVAPHTVDGGLVVDGVLVSGYSRAVHPWIAHALLAPVRWYVGVSGAVEPFGTMFYGGGRGLHAFFPAGAAHYEWLM